MSFDSAFLTLMPDEVVVTQLSALDGYGAPTYAGATTYAARVSRKQQLVRTLEGTESVAQTVIWIASTSTFAPSARFSVSGSTVGPLMALEAIPDEDGIHHLKAYFG